ncbi:MAG: alpha/beta hydrolase [Deltaproteobacteria bacterium]|nr:alpha/beta hydrolase [Deltaproteobacteria bacterium]
MKQTKLVEQARGTAASFFVLFLFAIAIASDTYAGTYQFDRTDGTKLTYYLDTPGAIATFPLFVYISGSVCNGVRPAHENYLQLLQYKIGVLSLEKRGFPSASPNCPDEYLRNNTIGDRIQDHLAVIAHLRKHLPNWNRKVVWAGGSEGGGLASLLAPLAPETAIVVAMAAGGGMSMGEELILLTRKRLQKEGATQEQIESEVHALRTQYQEIYRNPTADKEWLSDGKRARNTYKWWASILPIKSVLALEQVDVPIYLVHGTLDESTPVESANLVADRFQSLGKNNLTYKRDVGLDHQWRDEKGISHAAEVTAEAFRWLISHL